MKHQNLLPGASILIWSLFFISGCGTGDPEATNLEGIELRITAPAPDDTVDASARLTFTWELTNEPNGTFSYFHQFSRSATFHEDSLSSGSKNGYQSGLVLSHLTTLSGRPGEPLSGVWYWRIQMAADGYVSPWVERRFFVEENAEIE